MFNILCFSARFVVPETICILNKQVLSLPHVYKNHIKNGKKPQAYDTSTTACAKGIG